MSKIIDKTFPVNGMSCAVCSNSVETILNNAEGVLQAKVNFANNTAFIKYDSSKTNPKVLGALLQKADFELVITNEDANIVSDANAVKKTTDFRNRFLVSLIFTSPVFVISMFVMEHSLKMGYLMFALSLPVLFYSGSRFFTGAWKQAMQMKANMDTLVALSAGIAFLFSTFIVFFHDVVMRNNLPSHTWFESATVIITFVLLGKYLEEKSKRKASESIRKLIQLQPRTVLLKNGTEEIEVDIDRVNVDDLIIVKSGQIIPVDGMVDSGESFVDESSISGESVPVHKKEGNKVFAGTLNQNGLLYIRAVKVGANTLIAKIIRMVEEAQSSKAPIQKLVDKIAGVFVPVILGIAIITFSVWLFFGPEGQKLSMALLNSLTVLVIACPCALGLATPTALIAGVGRGAENGILIRDAEALEQAYQTHVVVFDKTGTLTKGKPQVVENWMGDHKNLADIVYSIEFKSDHPYAKAICSYLEDKKTEAIDVQDVKNLQGLGIQATCGGVKYSVVSAKHLSEMQMLISEEVQFHINNMLNQGSLTVIAVVADSKIEAVFGLRDEVRPESAEAIKALKNMGIHAILLSGDNEKVVADIAGRCGIEEYYAAVMPDKKGELIARLQKEHKIVAMVGDGINDSHALAKADVGIAMGTGSDIAIETASITLTNSNLMNVPGSIQLSKNTIRVIRENLFWAFIYNVIAIPIAAGLLYPINGLTLNPMIAGAAMAMSSVTVVMNSLRLKRMKI